MNIKRLAATAATAGAVGGLGLTGVASADTTAPVTHPTQWVYGWYCSPIAQPNPLNGVYGHWGWHKAVGQSAPLC